MSLSDLLALHPELLTAGVVFLISLSVLFLLRLFIWSQLQRLTSQTHTSIDDHISDALKKIGWPFYLILPFYAASSFLQLPAPYPDRISQVTLVVVAFYLVLASQDLVTILLRSFFQLQRSSGAAVDKTISGIIIVASRGLLWLVAVMLVMQNLGFNITALMGGVGIAGLAISFALQNILSDIFSFFSIYFDKPFAVGDFIVVGTESGTVEKIGLKSTRVRTLDGEELVVSNSSLTNQQIHNFHTLKKRRVVIAFHVHPSTSVSKLESIPQLVEEICSGIDDIDLNRAHFKALGDASYEFEVVYHVPTNDYTVHMDAKQTFNLKLLAAFKKAKIELAFPNYQSLLRR